MTLSTHLIAAALLGAAVLPAAAQTPAEPPETLPGIAARTKGFQRIDGLIPLYWQPSRGRLFMAIGRLNQELLYQVSLPTGLGSNPVGLDRGQLAEPAIVFFERVGRKVMLTQPNYRYRALTGSPAERRAVDDGPPERQVVQRQMRHRRLSLVRSGGPGTGSC